MKHKKQKELEEHKRKQIYEKLHKKVKAKVADSKNKTNKPPTSKCNYRYNISNFKFKFH
jgi:hypothetical protein